MTTRAVPALAPSPADAYRTTGTSPGAARHIQVRLPTDHGGWRLQDVTYQVYGPAHAPVTIVLGGISADRHLAPTPVRPTEGWWPGVIGPGAALDTRRRRLIGIDWIAAGAHPVTTGDQARAVAAVLDDLGVERASLVGASYGGMVALAFAERFGARAAALLVLCAAHRSHPMATALRVLQRRTVRLGVRAGHPEIGLALGRALAMTTYRSPAEFEARFDWRACVGASEARFPVEDYLDARGAAFAERFDPDVFTALSESIDLHSVEPRAVRAPTTLVSFDTDALVPPWLVDELAERAPGVRRHLALRSLYGHDAFLKEADAVSEAIRSTLTLEAVR